MRPKNITQGQLPKFALLVLLFLGNACKDYSKDQGTSDESFKPCYLRQGSKASCASFQMPWHHEGKSLPYNDQKLNETVPELKVHFAKISSSSGLSAADPILVLVGGPGQAGIEYLEYIAQTLSLSNSHRDIYTLDYRGTGKSYPLNCETNWGAVRRHAGFLDPELSLQELATCKEKFPIPLGSISTSNIVNDIESARARIGIKQWNLYGISYGSRVALAYMRLYPDSIRSAILEGATGFEFVIAKDAAIQVKSALRRIADECLAQVDCKESYGDIFAKATELFHRLRLQSGSLKVHFSQAELETLSFGEDDLFKAIQGQLYRPQDWTSLPLKIHRAHQAQDYAPLFATIKSESMISTGMYLSIICQEDLPYDLAGTMAANSEDTAPFKNVLPDLKPFCDLWLPDLALQDKERIDSSFSSKIPLLVLSGEFDPVTPPAAGKGLLPNFAASTQILFAKAGHNVMGTPCAQKIFKAFVADPAKFLGAPKGDLQKCAEVPYPYRYYSTFYGFNL